MKKTQTRIYKIEWLITSVLVLCTLFQILNNKYITALLTTIIAVIISLLYNNKRALKPNRRKVTIILLIFAILYIALFYMMGIYTGFKNATITFGLKAIFQYIIPIGIIIISTEIIRDKLLLDTTNQSKVLVVVIGTLIDISIYRNIYNLSSLNGFLSFLGLICLTAIANNLFYTYMNNGYGYKPVVLYKLITMLYTYILPITPNIYNYFRIFIRLVYPLIMYLYIDKYFDLDSYKESNKSYRSQILSLTGTSIVIILMIALISCQFTYGLLVIGSSSMAGSINKGDAIFFKNSKKIEVGDVIVFKSNDVRVVHRVIDIKNINNETRYYTKGDNNKLKDEGYVTNKTLIGKVLFKIKYLGRPTLWLRNKFE